MFLDTQPVVVVAGAGPVGLFAALRLAQHGIEVAIVDGERQRGVHDYAIALHPSTIRLFEQAGLIDALLAEGAARIDRIALYDGDTQRAGIDLSRLDDPYPFVVTLGQDRLERMLERALADAGVEIHWNHRLSRFDQRAEHVEVTVEELTAETLGYAWAQSEWVVQRTAAFTTDFVIGADGYGSVVRQQLRIEFPQVHTPKDFAIFEFATDAPLGSQARLIIDDDSTNVLWPLPNRYCRCTFDVSGMAIPPSPWTYETGASAFPVLEPGLLQTLLADRAPWFSGSIDDIQWRVAMRFESRLATAFGLHRMWLAGDAAHATLPIGEQGVNVGLHEAAVLADTIARIVHADAPLHELERYGADRITAWGELLGLTSSIEPGPAASSWVRSRADRIVPCLPASEPDLGRLARQLDLHRKQHPWARESASASGPMRAP